MCIRDRQKDDGFFQIAAEYIHIIVIERNYSAQVAQFGAFSDGAVEIEHRSFSIRREIQRLKAAKTVA